MEIDSLVAQIFSNSDWDIGFSKGDRGRIGGRPQDWQVLEPAPAA